MRYEFDVTPEAEARTVPVMSVQGLVENACKHGIQGLNGQGYIRVNAWVEADGTMVVEVCDNGVGMRPDRLESLQKQIVSTEDMPDSIGLQNIYRRLVLHYGKTVVLELHGAKEHGTIATIRISVAEGA